MDILLHTYTLKVPFFLKNVRHTGIEVFGKEYTFSMSGVTTCNPRQSRIGNYVKSYSLAHIELTQNQFAQILDALGKIYRPNTYNFIYKNCNHFCDDLYYLLCGRRLLFQFMFYSRLGKVFGKMKSIGFCGQDNYGFTESDDIIYKSVSKLSRVMIEQNEKSKSMEKFNYAKKKKMLFDNNTDNRYRYVPHPRPISTTRMHLPHHKASVSNWNTRPNITRTSSGLTIIYNDSMTNCGSTNKEMSTEEFNANITAITATKVKKGYPNELKEKNPAFKTIHSFSTACSL